MADEVLEILSVVPAGLVVDATVGGGGHAARLLSARSDLRLVGVDRDEAAVQAARRVLEGFGDRATVVRCEFGSLDEVVRVQMQAAAKRAKRSQRSQAPDTPVTGVLFDLGVSSHQLDEPARGFSYRHDAPLDMRMDTTQERTAADLVNDLDERDLTDILRRYGEEKFARSIARQIIKRRPLVTTGDLVEAIRAGIPARARRSGGHPAKRTFQALRIATNRELEQLEAGLDAAFAMLATGGRMVVLSYQSLEDRIVKQRFRDWSTGGLHPPGLPTRESARGGSARMVTRRALRPSPDEVARNPRAESARLRALEKLAVADPGGAS